MLSSWVRNLPACPASDSKTLPGKEEGCFLTFAEILRKSEVFVERISVCNVIEKLAEHGKCGMPLQIWLILRLHHIEAPLQ